jgi:hypothetical protein
MNTEKYKFVIIRTFLAPLSTLQNQSGLESLKRRIDPLLLPVTVPTITSYRDKLQDIINANVFKIDIDDDSVDMLNGTYDELKNLLIERYPLTRGNYDQIITTLKGERSTITVIDGNILIIKISESDFDEPYSGNVGATDGGGKRKGRKLRKTRKTRRS